MLLNFFEKFHCVLEDARLSLENTEAGCTLSLFYFLKYNFIYFWLCWVFFAACWVSLLVGRGGYSLASQCLGFSCCRSLGSRVLGLRDLQQVGSVLVAHGLSCFLAFGIRTRSLKNIQRGGEWVSVDENFLQCALEKLGCWKQGLKTRRNVSTDFCEDKDTA